MGFFFFLFFFGYFLFSLRDQQHVRAHNPEYPHQQISKPPARFEDETKTRYITPITGTPLL